MALENNQGIIDVIEQHLDNAADYIDNSISGWANDVYNWMLDLFYKDEAPWRISTPMTSYINGEKPQAPTGSVAYVKDAGNVQIENNNVYTNANGVEYYRVEKIYVNSADYNASRYQRGWTSAWANDTLQVSDNAYLWFDQKIEITGSQTLPALLKKVDNVDKSVANVSNKLDDTLNFLFDQSIGGYSGFANYVDANLTQLSNDITDNMLLAYDYVDDMIATKINDYDLAVGEYLYPIFADYDTNIADIDRNISALDAYFVDVVDPKILKLETNVSSLDAYFVDVVDPKILKLETNISNIDTDIKDRINIKLTELETSINGTDTNIINKIGVAITPIDTRLKSLENKTIKDFTSDISNLDNRIKNIEDNTVTKVHTHATKLEEHESVMKDVITNPKLLLSLLVQMFENISYTDILKLKEAIFKFLKI